LKPERTPGLPGVFSQLYPDHTRIIDSLWSQRTTDIKVYSHHDTVSQTSKHRIPHGVFHYNHVCVIPKKSLHLFL